MKETVKIQTLKDNQRLSTQELLQQIFNKVEKGYTNFEIEACGQHNIGGSLWSKNGEELNFKVTNPGQRVGAMAMAGTKIIVEGSAPADVGWLNSGAEIIVNGDGGDTSSHCAAGGKIYIAGRVGTRSGAMMKHDPKFEPPEFWVLKNTGSFSFEFMGGGVAVVCGEDSERLESVLGQRSCVGMVGGTIYVRGNIQDLANCVKISPLSDYDKEFLKKGLKEFLEKINKKDLYKKLSKLDNWQKIVPKKKSEHKIPTTLKEFRSTKWVKGGIFGDFVGDDFAVYDLAAAGAGRLNIPVWNKTKCIDCKICLNNCPKSAINENNKIYSSNSEKCIGCGICKAVCPKDAWAMQSNIREIS